jgi:hypothetical protein
MQYANPAGSRVVIHPSPSCDRVAPSPSCLATSASTPEHARSGWARTVVPGWSSVRCSSSRNGIPAGRVRHRNFTSGLSRGSHPVRSAQNLHSASYTSAAMSRQNWSTRLTEPQGHRAVGGLVGPPSSPDTQNGRRPGDWNTASPSSVSTRRAPSPSARAASSAQSAAWKSRWQPTGPSKIRCTRRYASPSPGTNVAKSPRQASHAFSTSQDRPRARRGIAQRRGWRRGVPYQPQ